MREIKFRGRTLSTKNPEWTYGYYLYDAIHKRHFILTFDLMGNIRETTVDSETVGEYTGLKDKNGKEIFEGDIINIIQTGYAIYENVNAPVIFIDGEFKCNDNSLGYQLANTDFAIEVIGNIYENPELLK